MMSALNMWISAHKDTDVVSKEDLSFDQANGRLQRENRILKEAREILERPRGASRANSREVLVN